MKLNPKWGSSSLLGLMVLLVSACGSFNAPADVAPSPHILTLEPTSELPAYITLETPSTTTATLAVEVFYPDSNCEQLVPETVTVDLQDGMEEAIAQVLKKSARADIAIAGYQVTVNAQGLATVDFRLSPSSPRHFASLSSCEKFALFGSVRQTLISNRQWQIQEVRFTEQGADLVL